ncbi:LamG domain-containing protein [Candidatus Poribacteria bacterium]|nr:LamG domain-containing protein [Candidatus Poribacteria bacterium]MYF57088.1 LamG domain-containing protein [Candidatus Poribacteria bacterium]MYI94194.1 LamG domain-containing protein [Candidatus Poribacteria bacterium]
MKTINLLVILSILSIVFFSQPLYSQSVTDGLVAHWKLNDASGTTVGDSSGNGHEGTLVGDPQWTDGYFDGALDFDGTEDEVDIPFHENLNQETFTITAWANATTGGTGHRAVVSSRDDFPQRGFIFYATPNNIWQFWTGGGGWNPISGPAVNLDDWDHLVGTYADGLQRFYVNGEFVGETNATISVNTAQEFLIGAGANETATHNYRFVGKIDDVRVYDRVLDESEIALVMESQVTPVDSLGKIAVTWGQLKAK